MWHLSIFTSRCAILSKRLVDSARGFKFAIIVCSAHHMRRARMIFRKVFEDQKDISFQFNPAKSGDFEIHKWWTREGELISVVNEYCILILYFFKYMI